MLKTKHLLLGLFVLLPQTIVLAGDTETPVPKETTKNHLGNQSVSKKDFWEENSPEAIAKAILSVEKIEFPRWQGGGQDKNFVYELLDVQNYCGGIDKELQLAEGWYPTSFVFSHYFIKKVLPQLDVGNQSTVINHIKKLLENARDSYKSGLDKIYSLDHKEYRDCDPKYYQKKINWYNKLLQGYSGKPVTFEALSSAKTHSFFYQKPS